MADQEANFSDVLSISVDNSKLASGLQEAEQLYTQFVDRANAKGVNPDAVVGSGAIADALKNLMGVIADLRASITEVFQLETDSANAAADSVEAAVEREVAAVKEGEEKKYDMKRSYQERVAQLNAQERERQSRNASRFSEFSSFDGRERNNIMFGPEAQSDEAYIERIGQLLEQQLNTQAQFGSEYRNEVRTQQEAIGQLEESRAAAGEKGGFLNGFLPEGGLAGFGEYIGSVFRFALAWAAVGEALNLVGAAIKAPFEAIAQGYHYLLDFQERASQLKAALTESIIFSDDPAKNMELAADAADKLTRKIDNLATKLHVNSKIIQTGFETFLSFGGRNLTENVEQGADLSALVTAALQAQNPQIQTRKLQTEIEGLVQGRFTTGSRLPAALGLTDDQLKQMVEHAKTYHDLYDEIILQAPGLTERLSEADSRQISLAAAIDLYKQRWEALVAGPAFDRITQIMKDVLDYLDKHDAQLQEIGKQWGVILDEVVKTAEEFVKGNWDGIKESFQLIAGYAVLMARSVASTLSDLFTLVKIGKDVVTNFGHPFDAGNAVLTDLNTNENNQNNIDKLTLDSLKIIAGKYQRPLLTQSGLDFIKGDTPTDSDNLNLFTNTSNATPNGRPAHGIVQPPGKSDAIQKLREQYAERVEEIRSGEELIRQEIDRSEKMRTVSVEDGEKQRQASYQREIDALRNFGNSLKAELDRHTDITEKDKEKFKSVIDVAQKKTSTSLTGSIVKSQDKVTGDEQKIQEVEDNGEQQRALAQANNLLAIKKELAKQGIITVEAEVAAERDAENEKYRVALQGLQRKLALAGQDRAAQEAAFQQMFNLEQQHHNALEALDRKSDQARKEQQRINLQGNVNSAANDLARAQEAADAAQGESKQRKAEADIAVTQANLKLVDSEILLLQAQLDSVPNIDRQTKAYQDQVKALEDLQNKKQGLVDALSQEGDDKSFSGRVKRNIFGSTSPFHDDEGNSKFGDTVDSLNKAFNKLGSAVNAVTAAYEQNGVGGAIGAGLTQVGGAIGGVAGGVLTLVGNITSMISGLFTKAAQDIGKEIGKEISQTMAALQTQQITLLQAIQQLEQERNKLIQEESGKKGGQKVLDQMLPNLDQQIASLKQQQKQISDNFVNNLTTLKLSNGVSSVQDWLQQWVAINQQVKDYIGAVGNAGKANVQQFLNLQLQQMRKQLQDQLNDGEQQAVQDALQLNQLLQQRNDLEQNYQKTQFQILNGDSIEKRGNPAVESARKLAEAKKQFDEQAQQLDFQIAQTQQKLGIEQQIFNIAQTTAQLQQQSLDLQLSKLKEMKDNFMGMLELLNNTSNLSAGGGLYNGFVGPSLYDGLGAVPGFGTPGSNIDLSGMTITINPPPGTDGKKLAGDLLNELRYRMQSRGGGLA